LAIFLRETKEFLAADYADLTDLHFSSTIR
jgi:hypothetical protein